MNATVGSQLAQGLRDHDVDLLFCVPGESYLGLTDAIGDIPELRLIVCRHESGAAFMAVADGRMRGGRAGVCVVSRGPGLSNAMIGLHSAFHDATPMVVLIGQVERRDAGRMALQEQNYGLLLADITKQVIEVGQATHAGEALARAFHVAESGTPGPVAVILPEDLLDAPAEGEPAQPRPRVSPGPRPEAVDELARRLAASERPLVYVGGGYDAGATEELRVLAERWALPIVPTNRHPHLFDTTHPNYGGYLGTQVGPSWLERAKQADLLVALGERLTDTTSQSYSFPAAPEPQIPLVHVWPDPGEVNRVWRAALGVVSDPAALVRALLAREATPPSEARRRWLGELHAIHRSLMEPGWEPAPDGVNFAAVCCAVAERLAPDATVTTDAGNFSTFVHRYIPFRPGQMFLASVVGAMGSGVPMAVAAALRRPGGQVVSFIGDGGMLMTGSELATAQLYGLAPVLIVSDNSVYGTIGMHHARRYPGRPFGAATRLRNPDFAAWGRSFGAEAFTISEDGQAAEVIDQAFAVRERPVVVHVRSSAIQTTAWKRLEEGAFS